MYIVLQGLYILLLGQWAHNDVYLADFIPANINKNENHSLFHLHFDYFERQNIIGVLLVFFNETS